ncbi:MAG: hypothetical protein GX877_02600 [Bacteroidales bacterium]|nr:hypothetical protein [Bacteroidales bacterium]
MPFIDQIIRYSSLSVVGLGKNTGKTECLRYITRRLFTLNKVMAITSVGIDGEAIDRVTATSKPEVLIEKGMYFTTVGSFYLQKRFTAEICHVEKSQTVLGKMITARALERGTLVLAGPSDTLSLQRWIHNTSAKYPVDICLVDGAVSRLSPASPAVTESMVLTTGAAFSANIKTLVAGTRFVYDTIQLPAVPEEIRKPLENITKGIRTITEDGQIEDPGIDSALTPDQIRQVLDTCGNRIYIPGVLSNGLLKALTERKEAGKICLYVRDFSRIFAEPATFYAFLRKGGRMAQLLRPNLLAVCVNPVSPEGYCLRSEELVSHMQDALNISVYDIKNIKT